ncbi:hypothetical protein [Nitrospirillum amazonense]|uniref:Secreted protein n=1 Tax=Nitrospirillum amazonense TaxID=28077 RepID=A0A560JLA2_9PROT|nr:hypothetical protein [Nitrospirillum amazonense]MDG3442906.1 hypothetical protein [Nitrospirillum amazonense]TWB71973.1 hypothetical protein FBZ87_106217 [Nitrospirillum amazonense]
MMRVTRSLLAMTALLGLGMAPASAGAAEPKAKGEHHPRYDYPTAVRADYVIGCLASNGFKHELLGKCACGIDTIADMMPYDDYEKADTILRMQQGGLGDRGAMFRDTPIAKDEVEKLRRAQAEVNLRCT